MEKKVKNDGFLSKKKRGVSVLPMTRLENSEDIGFIFVIL